MKKEIDIDIEQIIHQKQVDGKWEDVTPLNPTSFGDKLRIRYGDEGFVFHNPKDNRRYIIKNGFTLFSVEMGDDYFENPIKLVPGEYVELIFGYKGDYEGDKR